MILEITSFLLYLAVIIASAVMGAWPAVPFNCHLIAPIQVSALFLAAILSVLICYPFTIQFAKTNENIPMEVIRTQGFKKINMQLSLVWLFLFTIMTASSWVEYVYFSSQGDEKSPGSIILGSVIPILVPVLGIPLMPVLAQYFKGQQKGGDPTAAATVSNVHSK